MGALTVQGVPTYDFTKFSQKLHESVSIWTPGGGGGDGWGRVPGTPALDPPLVNTYGSKVRFRTEQKKFQLYSKEKHFGRAYGKILKTFQSEISTF